MRPDMDIREKLHGHYNKNSGYVNADRWPTTKRLQVAGIDQQFASFVRLVLKTIDLSGPQPGTRSQPERADRHQARRSGDRQQPGRARRRGLAVIRPFLREEA